MTIKTTEVNFECLVGPSHNFAGLSLGNLASFSNKMRIASPKKAGLQSLNKMKFLSDLGFKVAIFPPHKRPNIRALKILGFSGSDEKILSDANKHCKEAFFASLSSSFMWAANMATIGPSADSLDNKVHLTPANLQIMFHRSLEKDFAYKIFKKVFAERKYFCVHEPLLSHDLFSDEGAANHNRIAYKHEQKGIQIFVYSKNSSYETGKTKIYPSRQSKMAQEAIARRHNLDVKNTFFIEQNPLAIDFGAFHNDVVGVSNESVFLCHSLAFLNQEQILYKIKERFKELYNKDLHLLVINEDVLDLKNTVSSYLFNSQILTKEDGKMLLFAPENCLHNQEAMRAIEEILSKNSPINEVKYINLSESMANGGGPACLRLRILLNDLELSALSPSIIFNDKLYKNLIAIVDKYYLDELNLDTMLDKEFHKLCEQALLKIYEALDLADLYPHEDEKL